MGRIQYLMGEIRNRFGAVCFDSLRFPVNCERGILVFVKTIYFFSQTYSRSSTPFPYRKIFPYLLSNQRTVSLLSIHVKVRSSLTSQPDPLDYLY